MLRFFNCKRIISYIFLSLANLPMPGRSRWWYLKMAGVKFDINNNCKPNIFIGKNVLFDTLRPDNITIMNNVHITSGTKILTHYYNPVSKSFNYGNVRICEGFQEVLLHRIDNRGTEEQHRKLEVEIERSEVDIRSSDNSNLFHKTRY